MSTNECKDSFNRQMINRGTKIMYTVKVQGFRGELKRKRKTIERKSKALLYAADSLKADNVSCVFVVDDDTGVTIILEID